MTLKIIAKLCHEADRKWTSADASNSTTLGLSVETLCEHGSLIGGTR